MIFGISFFVVLVTMYKMSVLVLLHIIDNTLKSNMEFKQSDKSCTFKLVLVIGVPFCIGFAQNNRQHS